MNTTMLQSQRSISSQTTLAKRLDKVVLKVDAAVDDLTLATSKLRLCEASLATGMDAFRKWKDQNELIRHALLYLDLRSLLLAGRVNKEWMNLCNVCIADICKDPKEFETHEELKQAAKAWCRPKPCAMDNLARTYGYPINKWRVGKVTDFSYIFRDMENFNDDISSWDVSNATSMRGMFYWAMEFNSDISFWDMSNVRDMKHMFYYAHAFNAGIAKWNVSSAVSMEGMFYMATQFNQNLGSWDTSGVTDMGSMFHGARSFNGNIDSWDVSRVESMSNMFFDATNFDGNLESWDVSNVGSMDKMFAHATNFNGNIGS